MPNVVKPGDVYVAQMADGRYKAVRVLRRQGTYSVVYTCSYLGKARPAIDDPRLRKVVIQRRFFFKRVAARYWLEGKPPRSFELLGNLPLTKKEAAIRCNSGAGRWDATSGDEAFLEWRWIHDRPAFEEERRREEAERERIRLRPQKPRKMMSVRVFWTIIGLLDWKRRGNDKKVLAPAVKALAAKPEAEILAFQERLAYLLYRLDTRAHAQSMRRPSRGKESDFFSADGFLYARCVVVANGRELYEMVQKDPTKMPRGLEFEAILGLAPDAFELKTGRRFEYSTGCSYESFSNPIGWRE